MNPPRLTKESDNFFTKRREPLTFLLWTGIIGIVIIFLVLSLLYFIRKPLSEEVSVKIPWFFWISTLAISVSSITLLTASRAFKQELFKRYTSLLGITLFLGFLFVIMQLLGWREMFASGIFIDKNKVGAFIYILSGLHIAHVMGGLFFVSVAFREALKQHNYVDAFVYTVNPPNQLKLKLLSIYWHFIDILWLYLFLFFLLIR
jgi:cytochrome c oxidase subunit 3